MATADQPTVSPTRKVAAAGIGGSVSILVVYLIQLVFSVELPAEVAAAITALVSFGSGYLVKEEV